jgi:DNA-3-methyladenine glycosylase II
MGERVIVGGAILGAARVGGRTIGLRVEEEAGDSASPGLRCTLTPADVDGATADVVLGRIGDWLGLADDLAPFYALAEADPPFQAIVRRLYGYHQVRFFTPFEIACWAILGQRTPFAAARAAKRRLMERHGGAAEVEGHTILGFPEPADVAELAGHALAALVGSERKADRLLAIARAFEGAGPAALRAMPTEQLGAWLLALPGIGPWSVAFILLRGFGRVDGPLPLGVTPAFDRELLQAGRAVYGPDLTTAGLARIAERYGAQWGAWAHYLRVAG